MHGSKATNVSLASIHCHEIFLISYLFFFIFYFHIFNCIFVDSEVSIVVFDLK